MTFGQRWTTHFDEQPIFIIIFAGFLPNDDSNMIFKSNYLFHPGKKNIGNEKFELFDFDIFRVRRLKAHAWLPISNFYWHFLSRNVSETFDFKVFRFWPWPMTSRGHLRSKILSPFESPCMTSCLTSMGTFCLSPYRFWDILLQSFQGLTLTFDLQRPPEVKNIFTIRMVTHDFLSNAYWHFLSRTVFERIRVNILKVE